MITRVGPGLVRVRYCPSAYTVYSSGQKRQQSEATVHSGTSVSLVCLATRGPPPTHTNRTPNTDLWSRCSSPRPRTCQTPSVPISSRWG